MDVISGWGVSADNDALRIAKTITTACWTQLEKPLLTAFDAEDRDGKVHKNACAFLEDKRALSADAVAEAPRSRYKRQISEATQKGGGPCEGPASLATRYV